jgi:dephospho-CoA kinase
VESPHWRHQLDRILIVDCTEETQIRRVQARNGWERVAVEAVIRQQSAR